MLNKTTLHGILFVVFSLPNFKYSKASVARFPIFETWSSISRVTKAFQHPVSHKFEENYENQMLRSFHNTSFWSWSFIISSVQPWRNTWIGKAGVFKPFPLDIQSLTRKVEHINLQKLGFVWHVRCDDMMAVAWATGDNMTWNKLCLWHFCFSPTSTSGVLLTGTFPNSWLNDAQELGTRWSSLHLKRNTSSSGIQRFLFLKQQHNQAKIKTVRWWLTLQYVTNQ